MNSQDFLKYSNIFIDCDGVIIDSNSIKEENISKVLKKYLSQDIFSDCLIYFNSNPGMPREKKLSKFIYSENILNCILDEYNKLNLESLKNSKLVDGVIEFLKDMCSENKPTIAEVQYSPTMVDVARNNLGWLQKAAQVLESQE